MGTYHAAWVFAGGALGAGPRLLVEGVAFRVAPFHALFARGLWRSSRGGYSVVSLGGAGDRIGALGPFGPTAEGDVELL